MADTRIRRVPVVTHDKVHHLVGIVSLGDMATKTEGRQKQGVEQTVEKVSSPSEPDLSQRDADAVGGGRASETGKKH